MVPYPTRLVSSLRHPLTFGLVALLGGMLTSFTAQAQSSLGDDARTVLAAEDLGISLARIQNRLDRLPDDAEARSILRLNYYVQVYARTPPLDLLQGFDIHNSPVPYATPLHNEMMSVMHPNPLYPSSISLNPIAGWAWKGLRR